MATIKVKPKQEVEPKDVAGRIIGLLFFLMLAAGAYYLFDMFRGLDINNENLQGEWRIPARFDETTEEYWQFTPAADGTQTGIALNYKRNKKTAERTDEIEYDYVLEEYINENDEEQKTRQHILITTRNVKRSEKKTYEIRITSLSKMELSVTFVYDRFTTELTRLTRPSMF